MISFLQSIARMDFDDSNDKLLDDFLINKSDDWQALKILCQHKIQYLFLKHILEQNRIELLNNKLGFDISSQLIFINQLYVEYLNYIRIITSSFNKDQIPYCIIKGFSISNELYKKNDTIYRQFSDADILIDKKICKK